MLRLQNHRLEHVDVSRTDPSRPVRLPRLAVHRLDQALTSTRPPLSVTDLTRVAALSPLRSNLSVPVKVGIRNRRIAHVPALDVPRRFPVSSIDLSRRAVGLPYGVPRYVNAATLKAIAGGRRLDRLLKKTHLGWEFVPNETQIDLTDDSQEFRLGRLTIFS